MARPRPERDGCYRFQWHSGAGLCPGRVVLPGPQPAARGLHAERDDDPGAGRVCGRLVAGRGAALAGLDGGVPDGGGDCFCALAQQEVAPWCSSTKSNKSGG